MKKNLTTLFIILDRNLSDIINIQSYLFSLGVYWRASGEVFLTNPIDVSVGDGHFRIRIDLIKSTMSYYNSIDGSCFEIFNTIGDKVENSHIYMYNASTLPIIKNIIRFKTKISYEPRQINKLI